MNRGLATCLVGAVLLFCTGIYLLAHAASYSVTYSVTTAPTCGTGTPAPAVQAGYTTLAYCLNGGDPANATISNFMSCGGASAFGTQKWFNETSNNWSDCGVSESGGPLWSQVTDPITSNRVLDFHWKATVDNPKFYQFEMATFNAIAGGVPIVDFPVGRLIEVKWHYDRVLSGSETGPGGFYAFDAYDWSSVVSMDPASGGGTNRAPVEHDYFETSGGVYMISGHHDWYDCGSAGCATGQINQTPNVNMAQPMVWDYLITTDGVQYEQNCSYLNGTLYGCTTSDYVNGTCGPSGYPPCGGGQELFHLVQRNYITLWLSGPQSGSLDQHTYIDYIAVWTCADWNRYKISGPYPVGDLPNTNYLGYDSQPPCVSGLVSRENVQLSGDGPNDPPVWALVSSNGVALRTGMTRRSCNKFLGVRAEGLSCQRVS